MTTSSLWHAGEPDIAPPNEVDPTTLYGGGEAWYTDYPALALA